MASMVAKACSSSSIQMSPAMSVQEKGSRNKRKFRADPPLFDTNKLISSAQNECLSYEFSAEKFEINTNHGQLSSCDTCTHCRERSDALKLDLGLSCALGTPKVEVAATEEFHDADWSDLTESQLEELVLCNLDTIFKTAIKILVACGYSEGVATKAVLRSGLCYGNKDTVTNIVDNALVFLRNGQELDPSREHYFEDLQQMEKYILAELVCVLREVRPFFSTGDAMWCLLICDMNVSHACSMETDNLSGLAGDGATNGSSSVSAQPQLKAEDKSSQNQNLQSTLKPTHSVACPRGVSSKTPMKTPTPCSHISQSEVPNMAEVSNLKPKGSQCPNVLVTDKEGPNSNSSPADKSFNAVGTSKSPDSEEKFVGSRRIAGITKREILRQRSIRLEKSYRAYGSKGSSRAGKLSNFGGLILDKKLKSISDSGMSIKNASLKISKSVGVDLPQSNAHNNLSTNIGHPTPSFSIETANNTISTSPKTILPSLVTPPALSATDTELSLSLPPKSSEAPSFSYAGLSYDKSSKQWVSHDKKDEMILKMVPRVRELQGQLQEWTDWANQKVMQAARRLSKDKAELKTLRQEKEEVERLKKEKQTLEEGTLKKLSEMEFALGKAGGQVERANCAVRRLEVENGTLRKAMEAAKLRANESATRCQESVNREKKTLMKFQLWDKQKAFLQEELVAEKGKLGQLQQLRGQAKELRDQVEAKWKQEAKAKEELNTQASTTRNEREQVEASAKSKDDTVRLKAEKNLQKYKDDIAKLEKEISQLRLKTDSSKIAALKRGIDGSYASRLTDSKTGPSPVESPTPYISKLVEDFSVSGGVKRERECVMCLSEEMSVVFMPCAHQVVCMACNELHEKQGMKDCPSCRSPIQRRICVRYARS